MRFRDLLGFRDYGLRLRVSGLEFRLCGFEDFRFEAHLFQDRMVRVRGSFFRGLFVAFTGIEHESNFHGTLRVHHVVQYSYRLAVLA